MLYTNFVLYRTVLATLHNSVCVTVQDHITPLHYAARHASSSLVESLIKCGANVNAVDKVIYLYKNTLN